jgi:NAD(P)-dependent dehydrogenase (short-subunit alcohol dehydrogenase family)
MANVPGMLKDCVAFVTGGGTGIGRGIALAFAKHGATVAVCGRRKDKLDETVSEINKSGGKAISIVGDVSKPEDCHSMVLDCVMGLGNLHILVNNAGLARFGSLDQTADEDIIQMLDVNLRGTILMTKYAIPELVKHGPAGNASILNIGTSAALSAIKNFSVYSAAKAGLIHFTRCMALELSESRVRVNCINPGVVETPIFSTMMPSHLVKSAMENFTNQTPLGRVGQPVDIAEAALYLCSPKAAWITGALLTVDGGISLT